MDDTILNSDQLDALKEIGNIGAGNAATALSQLVGKKILVNVPQADFIRIDKMSVSSLSRDPQELSIAISFRILGVITGGMMVIFPQRSALLLIDILYNRNLGSTEIFNIEDESALSECASILSCSYLNAIAQLLNLYQLIPSIRDTFIDQFGKLTQVIIRRFIPEETNFLLPIENRLTVEGAEINVFVIFLLEPASMKKMLKTAGI